MTRRVLMIVDLSNQVYKAVAAYPYLSSGDTYTGGLFGYMAGVCKAIREEGVTHLITAADAPPYVRSEVYPEYKKLRSKVQDPALRDAVHQSMDPIKELHGVLGLPIWRVPGYEFDDLAARAVVTQRRRFDAVIAMSNDSDLTQLLVHDNFRLYRGKKGRYTIDDFKRDSDWAGISPEQVVEFLSITGTHNDVAGIDQMGPARAALALQGDPKWAAKVKQCDHIVSRNRGLIQLPHLDLPSNAVAPVDYPRRFTARALYTFCAKFDINTTRSMLDSFEQVLG